RLLVAPAPSLLAGKEKLTRASRRGFHASAMLLPDTDCLGENRGDRDDFPPPMGVPWRASRRDCCHGAPLRLRRRPRFACRPELLSKPRDQGRTARRANGRL